MMLLGWRSAVALLAAVFGLAVCSSSPEGVGSSVVAKVANQTPPPSSAPVFTSPSASHSSASAKRSAAAASVKVRRLMATVVTSYDPWTASGELRPGVDVASSGSGKCTDRANDAPVYKCVTSAGATYGGCWPRTIASPVQVACDLAFSTRLVMMSITGPLPSAGHYEETEALPPSLKLADGYQCSQIWGTAQGPVDRVVLNYGCDAPSGSSDFYAGSLNSLSPQWTIKVAPRCSALPTYSCPRSGPLITMDVSHAWR